MLILLPAVLGAKFQSVEFNQNFYAPGDIVDIRVAMDKAGLETHLDASELISGFDEVMVAKRAQDKLYFFRFMIPPDVNTSEGVYSILINAFDADENISDALTINLQIKNFSIDQGRTHEITLIILDDSPPIIPEGSMVLEIPGNDTVTFCQGTNCTQISKEEYDKKTKEISVINESLNALTSLVILETKAIKEDQEEQKKDVVESIASLKKQIRTLEGRLEETGGDFKIGNKRQIIFYLVQIGLIVVVVLLVQYHRYLKVKTNWLNKDGP